MEYGYTVFPDIDVTAFIKVNVAVYKELFLELASGHVTIVTRVGLLSAPYRHSTCFG